MYLTFDIGTCFTKAFLYDENTKKISKLILPSDRGFDVHKSALQITRVLEKKTGKKLLESDNFFLCDSFACISINSGLKVAIASSLKNTSGKFASFAVMQAGGIIVSTISNDDNLTYSQKVFKLVASKPDLILITGGTERGTVNSIINISNIVATAILLINPTGSFPIIFAGNSNAQQEISLILKNISNFIISPNLLPEEGQQDIYPTVNEIINIGLNSSFFENIYLNKLRHKLSDSIIPSSYALIKASECLTIQKKAILINCGSSSTDTILISREKQYVKPVILRKNIDLGIGKTLYNAYLKYDIEKVIKWSSLPLKIDLFKEIILRRSKIYYNNPVNYIELELLHCYARKIISDLLNENIYILNEIFLSSFLFSVSPIQRSLFTIINAVQPVGITDIIIDDCFLANIGLLNNFDINLTDEISSNIVATVISPNFKSGSYGSHLAEIIIKTDKKTMTEKIKVGDFRYSSIDAQFGNLTIIPKGQIDVGAGKGNVVHKKINPSILGLILDGRGRPIKTEIYKETWYELISVWERNLGAKQWDL